ncbi:L-cystine transport system substrate-binding protein [Paenibacillus shirakamiensis]|uniref:L-cystine transport system substrate-binding protein n=1 Tax=Paenibacillus shirakamiensis TaxID=1265935 RepID=A0ABS4JIK0_9BACL|nr:transporter substrate-binding domain-containing protein [Paenibacillus shirakamiensis]MBP2001549.1 L-cystine transport system substrate-binding protein [Paenibacillus shirakamiensis]
MKKVGVFWVTISMLMTMLSGCGAEKEAAAVDAKTGSNIAVRKIIVGTGTQFPNVCFLDDKGKLTGFDVELVRELDKRLPEYEFEFKTMEFSSLLLSLGTKKIDFIAHQMEKNPEREEKFLFTKEPYSIFLNKVVVPKRNTDINSIDDLKGKKVITSATSNEAYILQQYNKKNNSAIDIVYSSGASNDTTNQILNGRVAATISTSFALKFLPNGDQLKTVGDALTHSDVLFVLRKDEQEVADKLDQAIKSVKDDGTLAKLSIQWLGEDFTKTK